MFKKTTKAIDAFTFSLGGMTAVASFFPAQAIADDRINKIRDAHVRQAQKSHDEQSGEWLQGGPQPAHDCA